MRSRVEPDPPVTPARNPEAPLAVTLGNLLEEPRIQGANSDTTAASPGQVYQLSKPPTWQDAAPPREGPVQPQEDRGRTKFADRLSAALYPGGAPR